MLLKAKCAQQSVLRELQKDQSTDASRMKKLKDPRKKIHIGVANISNITPVGLKRLHKPSKSTLEPCQHPHYNSPSNPLSQNQNLQINSFSFTNILQQNMKNKHSQQSISNLQYQRSSNFQMVDSKLSTQGLSHDLDARISQRNNKTKMNQSTNKELPIKMRDLSYGKVNNNSKSPSRIVNTNRINNTPKLKQQNKIEKDERTFRDLLDHKQNSSIRLQCSQKLFKFLQNEGSIQQLYPRSNFQPHFSDKSNLLSTGVISMSQKYENNKYSLQFNKNSKEDISRHQSAVENQQTKQFFHQDSSELSSEVQFEDRIFKIRSKLISSQMENKFSSQSTSLKEIQRLFFIEQSNNHCKQSSYNASISKLTALKASLIQNVNYIVSHVERLSYQFISHIEDEINKLNDMKNSSIDWFAIQREIQINDKVIQQQCQSEALLLRIQALQTQMVVKKIQEENNKMLFDAQLAKIEEKTLSLIEKKQQKNSLSSKKSSVIKQFFSDIQNQLKKLWSNFEQTLLFQQPSH